MGGGVWIQLVTQQEQVAQGRQSSRSEEPDGFDIRNITYF